MRDPLSQMVCAAQSLSLTEASGYRTPSHPTPNVVGNLAVAARASLLKQFSGLKKKSLFGDQSAMPYSAPAEPDVEVRSPSSVHGVCRICNSLEANQAFMPAPIAVTAASPVHVAVNDLLSSPRRIQSMSDVLKRRRFARK